ncbi:MAG: hypothetical protein IJH63_10875 [Methanobrevibacter sp.]|nr:hypothetical protein [Methanobrevibacter sp.]
MKNKSNKDDSEVSFYGLRNTQDLIFNFLFSKVKEFPAHLTGYKDIESNQPRNLINNLLKKSELDSLFMRKNGVFLNIEHQTVINQRKILKNASYILQLMEDNYEIEQIIVYTGHSDITKYIASNDIFVKTGWIETRKIDASIRLNNIYYKINNNQELNAYDICDACILPVYNHGKSNEELIDSLVYITKIVKRQLFYLKF